MIDGVVVGPQYRARHGRFTSFDPFMERPFALWSERLHINLRIEAFNVLNHANFVGFSGTYGNGATPGAGFGAALGRYNESASGAIDSVFGKGHVLI